MAEYSPRRRMGVEREGGPSNVRCFAKVLFSSFLPKPLHFAMTEQPVISQHRAPCILESSCPIASNGSSLTLRPTMSSFESVVHCMKQLVPGIQFGELQQPRTGMQEALGGTVLSLFLRLPMEHIGCDPRGSRNQTTFPRC